MVQQAKDSLESSFYASSFPPKWWNPSDQDCISFIQNVDSLHMAPLGRVSSSGTCVFLERRTESMNPLQSSRQYESNEFISDPKAIFIADMLTKQVLKNGEPFLL